MVNIRPHFILVISFFVFFFFLMLKVFYARLTDQAKDGPLVVYAGRPLNPVWSKIYHFYADQKGVNRGCNKRERHFE